MAHATATLNLSRGGLINLGRNAEGAPLAPPSYETEPQHIAALPDHWMPARTCVSMLATANQINSSE
jgi:hypothetical protein